MRYVIAGAGLWAVGLVFAWALCRAAARQPEPWTDADWEWLAEIDRH